MFLWFDQVFLCLLLKKSNLNLYLWVYLGIFSILNRYF
ncbi:hypothetical protein VPMS16_1570 [Vibrio sp. 16]|nr:hypothetical protein VPMS16_1570 [Vibrio sp. 16]